MLGKFHTGEEISARNSRASFHTNVVVYRQPRGHRDRVLCCALPGQTWRLGRYSHLCKSEQVGVKGEKPSWSLKKTTRDSGLRSPSFLDSRSKVFSARRRCHSIKGRCWTPNFLFPEELWGHQETSLAHTSQGQLKVFSNKNISL